MPAWAATMPGEQWPSCAGPSGSGWDPGAPQPRQRPWGRGCEAECCPPPSAPGGQGRTGSPAWPLPPAAASTRPAARGAVTLPRSRGDSAGACLCASPDSLAAGRLLGHHEGEDCSHGAGGTAWPSVAAAALGAALCPPAAGEAVLCRRQPHSGRGGWAGRTAPSARAPALRFDRGRAFGTGKGGGPRAQRWSRGVGRARLCVGLPLPPCRLGPQRPASCSPPPP